MSEFRVHVDVTGDVGRLRWDGQVVEAEALQRAVSTAADDALIAQNLRRIQVDLLATDSSAKRAVQRSGFRLEGRLRAAQQVGPDQFVDVLVYARLAVDPVHGPLGFSGVLDTVLPTKRVIGHAVFRNPGGSVLLCETNYKADWELPGGVVERLESPGAGCRREVLEETGLDHEFAQASIIDWMPPSLGWSDAVEFIFDGGVLGGCVASGLRARDPELLAVHWVARDEIGDLVTPLTARRIELLLDGYLGMTENGYPLGP